ncbi:MAG: TIR domain-containing protein [Zoogloeaceae bacterium]|uniref:LCCL domain-containing protein n=1 Tax=Denitromonas sp. TaxID=2734609 RepID=UPI001D929A7D|nr:TIR domain-containing protein [Rhodocyclaceae bacterium]MCP5222655.1 TIR domain-containing protein [Zoogloeaceae bacterium]
MGKTAFISHASEDAARAAEVCAALEAHGVPCWIAPRDVTPGHDYASEILDGIANSRVFVLLLSHEANDSGFVRREAERAVSKGKPIFPVRLENVTPSKALELFVSSAHWIDAWDTPRDAHWQRLAAVIRGERASAPAAPAPVLQRYISRAFIGLAALTLIGGVSWWFSRNGDTPTATPVPTPVPTPPSPTSPAAATPPPALPAPAVTPATPVNTAPVASAGPCPQRLSINPDLPLPFSCQCSRDAVRDGTVWGTDVYTRDSALCAAAAHAGVVGREGGEITALEAPGRDIYIGTARNGVTSNDYGVYRQSLSFQGAAPPADGPELCPQRLSINLELPTPYTCRCSAEAVGAGTVWGTDAYTGDSNLCSAAAHAGAVQRDGGVITVYREAGRDLYVGSARNGVTSNDYGRYANSLRFLVRAR